MKCTILLCLCLVLLIFQPNIVSTTSINQQEPSAPGSDLQSDVVEPTKPDILAGDTKADESTEHKGGGGGGGKGGGGRGGKGGGSSGNNKPAGAVVPYSSASGKVSALGLQTALLIFLMAMVSYVALMS